MKWFLLFFVSLVSPIKFCVASPSVDQVWDRLGFYDVIKKEALEKLCIEADIDLPASCDAKSLLQFIVDTQKYFTNRKPKQERWEVSPLKWMQKNPGLCFECLKNLGFTEDILPKNQNYNAICILGSTSPSMHDRMDFIEKLVANNKIFLESCKFFLLSGERYVSYVDGKDEYLVAIGEKMGVKKEMLTEALLLQNIFNNSPLSKRVESVLINTPMKNGFRPTTKTTVQEFCQWMEDHNFHGHVLFVSNQPNVWYQGALIADIMPSNVDFEVIGPKTNSKNIQTLVGALGSYLWAAMPRVMKDLGIQVISPEETLLAKSLYGSQF